MLYLFFRFMVEPRTEIKNRMGDWRRRLADVWNSLKIF